MLILFLSHTSPGSDALRLDLQHCKPWVQDGQIDRSYLAPPSRGTVYEGYAQLFHEREMFRSPHMDLFTRRWLSERTLNYCRIVGSVLLALCPKCVWCSLLPRSSSMVRRLSCSAQACPWILEIRDLCQNQLSRRSITNRRLFSSGRSLRFCLSPGESFVCTCCL